MAYMLRWEGHQSEPGRLSWAFQTKKLGEWGKGDMSRMAQCQGQAEGTGVVPAGEGLWLNPAVSKALCWCPRYFLGSFGSVKSKGQATRDSLEAPDVQEP